MRLRLLLGVICVTALAVAVPLALAARGTLDGRLTASNAGPTGPVTALGTSPDGSLTALRTKRSLVPGDGNGAEDLYVITGLGTPRQLGEPVFMGNKSINDVNGPVQV